MIQSSRGDEPQQTKKEESVPNGTSKFGTKTVLSSSRQWSAFRNPRIVRVSRSFGGKDRHSKVYTVRGLRDRRIRLSLPTAIQLYDLQERLGLSQPSKVIDWLMDSTKDDIDKLPPLQLPQASFGQFLQQSIIGGVASTNNDQISEPNNNFPLFFNGNSALFSSKDTGININNNDNAPLQDVGNHRSRYWDYLDAASKARSREVERDNELNQVDKVRWMDMNNNQHGLNHFQGLRGYNNDQVTAQNFFPVASGSTYNPYNQNWDRLENHRGITSSTMHQPSNNDHNSSSLLSASSSSTFGALIPSGEPQLFFCPPPSTSTFFPGTTTRYPPYSTASLEAAADPRHVNSHFHNLISSSSIKTFQLNNANPNKPILQHGQDGDDSSS